VAKSIQTKLIKPFPLKRFKYHLNQIFRWIYCYLTICFKTTKDYLLVINAYVLCYAIYHVDIALATDDNEFKIATADWSTIDFGAIASDDAVTEGVLKTLVEKGANMHFNATSVGTYRFTVTGSSTESPTLLVTKLN
jgi:hypothetical protein